MKKQIRERWTQQDKLTTFYYVARYSVWGWCISEFACDSKRIRNIDVLPVNWDIL